MSKTWDLQRAEETSRETTGVEVGTRFHVKGRETRKLRGGTRLGAFSVDGILNERVDVHGF